MDYAPLFNNQRVPDARLAETCLRCEYRDSYRFLLDVPFCYCARTTCTDPNAHKVCDLYKPKKVKQLSLFDD